MNIMIWSALGSMTVYWISVLTFMSAEHSVILGVIVFCFLLGSE